MDEWNVDEIRTRFPALARTQGGEPVVYFDGPAGSQVPRRVIDAVADYFSRCNANHGGAFLTSRESDAMLAKAQAAAADLYGVDDPEAIVFGANMTTLTFAISRAMARTWRAEDEIVVTRLDHDANVTPWVLAARDAGATIRHVRVRREDATLDLDDFASAVGQRTRLVAVGAASNAVGTINPIRAIADMAHAAGALVYVDAVHYAPHGLIDAATWDADFIVSSAYKYFGPHVGVLWGRPALLENLPAYKVRPAADTIPDRWMTGTPSFETIAGVLAAIEYLAELGEGEGGKRVESGAVESGEVESGGREGSKPRGSERRSQLSNAFQRIEEYERRLFQRLMEGLLARPFIKVFGITDPARMTERVPTVSFRHERLAAAALAERLADKGIFAWSGNFYALPFTEAMGLEPDGLLRVGLLHYNTAAEVDRLLAALDEF